MNQKNQIHQQWDIVYTDEWKGEPGKGELNENRLALVERAFEKLDRDKSGKIEVEDIIGIYNAKNHPAVLECRKTENEVLEEFLSTFE